MDAENKQGISLGKVLLQTRMGVLAIDDDDLDDKARALVYKEIKQIRKHRQRIADIICDYVLNKAVTSAFKKMEEDWFDDLHRNKNAGTTDKHE